MRGRPPRRSFPYPRKGANRSTSWLKKPSWPGDGLPALPKTRAGCISAASRTWTAIFGRSFTWISALSQGWKNEQANLQRRTGKAGGGPDLPARRNPGVGVQDPYRPQTGAMLVGAKKPHYHGGAHGIRSRRAVALRPAGPTRPGICLPRRLPCRATSRAPGLHL